MIANLPSLLLVVFSFALEEVSSTSSPTPQFCSVLFSSSYPCVTNSLPSPPTNIAFRVFNTPKKTCARMPGPQDHEFYRSTQTTGLPSGLSSGACSLTQALTSTCGPSGPSYFNLFGNNAEYLSYCYNNCYLSTFCQAANAGGGELPNFIGGCGCAMIVDDSAIGGDGGGFIF